ncbi:FAD-dependent oxidoreductase [Solirubrobacter phytolaccae]|uniref:FAD-dependent oxidoreductase n=1 Tax=Solirubrobacter phytolaccae TaxID=1404360 RepID=A0A9X3NEG7_9ACTN|nr:FAD-dependent oxidoreductase [Solirubrobacter phytolaccae]MDA0184649.1 FAD-dependent oxidoreductase [Solirubrobacter phytolaccae]
MDRVTAFPNYTQIPSRIPVKVWHGMRAGSIVAALILAALLIAAPDTGLFLMWKVVIPLLPLLFLTVPGLWRNLCPLAASNQTPRALEFTKALTAPDWLKEYGYVIAFSLFIGFVVLRKLGLDDSGAYSALLLLGAMAAAFTGGIFLKGKSGWCSTICPLLPVQRIYGQTPLLLVANAHCQPCVGCVKNCYDFNPRAAYLADLHDQDTYWSGYRKYFVGAFPGIVLGFFAVPVEQMALTTAVSLAVFATLITFFKTSAHTITTVFGATAFGIFYWYAADVGLDPLTYALRAAAIALAATWLYRTLAKEQPFLDKATAKPAPAAPSSAPAALSSALNRASGPQVTFLPDNKRVAPKPGQTLLEVIEANGLPIEAGCRMGICGADPVAIKDGMACTSEISDDEKATLERLGLATNTRMACCVKVTGPVSVQLTPEKPERPRVSQVLDFNWDRSVQRVVVIGNGIAGVTAADHLRRRHPATKIDLIAEEPHHLYNRMGISRLVYGRSAMQGLYLNPDAWYDERAITTWLNTRALWIDRANREVALGTGEKLPYDRLILANGSRSHVPSIDGFGAPGTGVLRSAADAMALRAYAQRVGSRRGVVAGGGLLGLEAAYALHKLGIRTTVLERGPGLLRRQLDQRAGELLKSYLEALGLEIILDAEVDRVDANGRLRGLDLKDGRTLPAQILLVAAGIEPNAELARDAQLATHRGVLVDDHMRTEDPHILAAGDVAEFDKQTPGLWPTAVAQAEVAAENAAGGEKTYVPAPPVTMLKVVGVELASIGRFEPQPDDEVIVHEGAGTYRKLLVADNRIVGAILLGPGNDVASLRAAITQGREVDVAALRRNTPQLAGV